MLLKTDLMTAEELAQLPPEKSRGQLVKGEFTKMSPAGYLHGRIVLKIGTFLNMYVMQHDLGEAYAAETGFILTHDPDTVRAPDAAFVTADRAARQEQERGYFDGPPDLAVEVISASETVAEIEEKLIDYLDAGTRLVWLIYPRTQTITVYRSLTDIHTLTINDTLDGGQVLPGFAIPVKDILS